MRLMPNYIHLFVRSEMFDEAEKYNAADCIECGACSYSCPAHLPLVQMMRMAKFKIATKQKKGGN